jgi:cystathionine beta-lyase/cystathionine gamma-synthase
LSKYIAGHNDVLAGALITNDEKLNEEFFFLFKTTGGILSPDECYRVLQGAKTLSLRWQRVSETAYMIARNLPLAKQIKNVYYPYLGTNPNREIAFRQMKRGAGGVLSFELEDVFHTPEKIKQFVDDVTSSGIIVYAESLASPETILAYPPLMSHKSMPDALRKALGISNGFFRLSVGFEDPDDILNTLLKAVSRL